MSYQVVFSSPEPSSTTDEASASALRILAEMGVTRSARVSSKPCAAGTAVYEIAEELLSSKKINEGEYKRLCDASMEVHGAVSASEYEAEHAWAMRAFDCSASLLGALRTEAEKRVRAERRSEFMLEKMGTAVDCVLHMQQLVHLITKRSQPSRAHLVSAIAKKSLNSRDSEMTDAKVRDLVNTISEKMAELAGEAVDGEDESEEDWESEEEGEAGAEADGA